jgi:hypothetical protein
MMQSQSFLLRWSNGPDNCRQTLLHRAIDENNESVACFLIKRYNINYFFPNQYPLSSLFLSGCDINSPRQPGLNGETPDICKTLESPLHLGMINKRKTFFFSFNYLYNSSFSMGP